MGQVKINRAFSQLNLTSSAKREILDSIPQELIEGLTSQELALMAQALNTHWHKAVKHAEKTAVQEGCIWSERDSKLLELH